MQNIQVSMHMMDMYVNRKKQKPLELPKLKYDKNFQGVRLLTGMPITARINTARNDIMMNYSLLNQSIGSTTQSSLQMIQSS